MDGTHGGGFGGGHSLAPFFARLTRHGGLGEACRAALVRAASGPRRLNKGDCTTGEGDEVHTLFVLSEGLALSSRRLPDGLQQHLAIQAPGEVLDLEGYVLERASVSTCALTRAAVMSFPRSELGGLMHDFPPLARALNREMAASSRVAQEWMVNMGRRSAYARLAHFLCEVQTRLTAANMGGPAGCPFPLTQSDLADTLGLSVVHTNRVLQQLRREGMIELAHSHLEVRNWSGLVEAAGFDPAYLHPA